MSLDGFAAGPKQTPEDPIGDGDRLHRWMFDRPDEHAAERAELTGAGAYVMGRNMYAGPGDWAADWTGWWGPEPPYRAPVFVLTHHRREPVPLEGGTTFYFVNDGIHSALEQAQAAAGDRNVLIAGGAATVNQYLAAGLIDELHLHVAPFTLGAGARLFAGVSDLAGEIVEARTSELVTHLRLRIDR